MGRLDRARVLGHTKQAVTLDGRVDAGFYRSWFLGGGLADGADLS